MSDEWLREEVRILRAQVVAMREEMDEKFATPHPSVYEPPEADRADKVDALTLAHRQQCIREWITGLTDEQMIELRAHILNAAGSATWPPHTRAALLALLPKEEGK